MTATGAASTGTAASVTVPTTPFVLAAAGAAAAVVAVPLGLVIGAGFLVPGAGETALVVDFLAATPFCCTFRTEGEVAPAVAAFGASEVRVVVVVLPAAVEDDAVFEAVVLASSNGFLAAAVVLLLLVLPAKPLPAVALVLVAAPVRGTVLLVVVLVVLVAAPSVAEVPFVSELWKKISFNTFAIKTNVLEAVGRNVALHSYLSCNGSLCCSRCGGTCLRRN